MTEDAPQEPAGLTDKRRAVYLGAAVALLLALVIPVALLGGGSGGGGTPDGAAGSSGAASSGDVSGQSVEGRLTVVERDRLVLDTAEAVDGRNQVELSVRPQDAEAVDVIHLKDHATQGLPSRIFYEQEGEARYAVGQQDADTSPAP